jgi:tetratricopeptide (TPR) repeat protein
VPGADGRHPPHTRLDPVAAHEAMEQMIALGYVERPDENREIAVAKTIRELQYNLGEAYQDGDRHIEAHRILTALHAAEPDEQRFAVRLFVSCQALGLREEMRRIAETLQPPVADYLMAQVLTAEKKYSEALTALERVTAADLVRPGLFLQAADLYLRLRRWNDAQRVYEQALAVDPDNAHAHLGLCRLALRRKKFDTAAQWALDALQRVHQYPLAHFLLGRALTGLKEYERAAEAFSAALSFNPNFPEAHVRLAALLGNHLGDAESARDHRRLARRMRRDRPAVDQPVETAGSPSREVTVESAGMPALEESLVIVTGLPRSGTSILMQMLAAGGMPVVSDGVREADDDNPRGYLEFERVKNLLHESNWLLEHKGCAIKIVAPLLAALPRGLACRVILSDRDLDEVLDSQERMLARRNRPASTAERRRMLKEEYVRTLARVEAMLMRRAATQLMIVKHSHSISDPLGTAEKLNRFLGGGLEVEKMAAAVDPALHRNRGGGDR